MTPFEVRYSREAEADLRGILRYLTEARGDRFAHAFVARIVAYCDGLARTPHRGTQRDEISPGLRTVGWRKTATIAFRIREERRQVQIAGVFYRGRDIASVLQERRESESE